MIWGTRHSPGRRRLIQGLSGLSVTALGRLRHAFAGGGRPRASGPQLRFFSPDEAARLDALGDALVPGARAAGLSRYIDHYVSVPPASSLLTLRYLDVAPPYGEFYRESLGRLEIHPDIGAALRRLSASEPLFYFTLHSDAVDVTYGTMSGFETLGVPYLPHIAPEAPW